MHTSHMFRFKLYLQFRKFLDAHQNPICFR